MQVGESKAGLDYRIVNQITCSPEGISSGISKVC